MKKLDCMIIEDEPLAAGILKNYISQIPFLHLAGIFTDAIYAIEFLQKKQVDLIFLDIHLPKLKGIDFLKSFKNPPAVIITTAYNEYALLGYEHSVKDYLMKPIEFARFLSAVNKVIALESNAVNNTHSQVIQERKYLFFNVTKKKIKIFLDEILYVESLKEYIRIVTKHKTIVTKFQLGQVEDVLTSNNIVRIHRSFMVAMDKIDAYTATDVEINGKEIPIGRSYKDFVQTLMADKIIHLPKNLD